MDADRRFTGRFPTRPGRRWTAPDADLVTAEGVFVTPDRDSTRALYPGLQRVMVKELRGWVGPCVMIGA
ncbi:hypothetical protein ACIP6X_42175 [Streptomyces coeruleorubidus]|uniref:hypothetical protein n=1 Tax=Streptomyces coeruleorubidus TaxID=116188 RepID=UPI0038020F28